VTLGWREQDDLALAIQHLRHLGTVSTIGLWGRSMGAVTALLYSQKDPSIAGVVSQVDIHTLDLSCFSNAYDPIKIVNNLQQQASESVPAARACSQIAVGAAVALSCSYQWICV